VPRTLRGITLPRFPTLRHPFPRYFGMRFTDPHFRSFSSFVLQLILTAFYLKKTELCNFKYSYTCGCNVLLHHPHGPRLEPLPQYTWPAPRAKLSVCFFSSHHVIVPSFPIVVTYPIMSLFSPVSIIPHLLLYSVPLY